MSKSEGGGMRKIDLIVIHCSATREDRCFTEFDLDVCDQDDVVKRESTLLQQDFR